MKKGKVVELFRFVLFRFVSFVAAISLDTRRMARVFSEQWKKKCKGGWEGVGGRRSCERARSFCRSVFNRSFFTPSPDRALYEHRFPRNTVFR